MALIMNFLEQNENVVRYTISLGRKAPCHSGTQLFFDGSF